MKDHARLDEEISRLNEELGNVKELVIKSGKSMPPAVVCKHLDEFQKDLDTLDQRTFAKKSDIVSLTHWLTALKWITTVKSYVLGK